MADLGTIVYKLANDRNNILQQFYVFQKKKKFTSLFKYTVYVYYVYLTFGTNLGILFIYFDNVLQTIKYGLHTS